jgi:tetratricopeptide (TPR) repeat protein
MAHITNEVVYHLGETYTGVIATPQLVGRAEILAQVLAEINRKDRSAIVYLVGPGGVGKTRLLTHLLRLAAQDASLMVAKELIDLYHVRNRSVGGLIQSLLDVVELLGNLVKEHPQETRVDDKLDELSRAEQEGLSTAELLGRREELTKILIDTINQFTKQRRLVLALDTAERLFVTPDLAQRRLGLTQYRPAILEWLLSEFLPKLENTVILVAGRPEPLNLTNELQNVAQQSARQFLPLTIQGLTEEEALAYFDAVIGRAEHLGNASDRQAAATIRAWSTNEKRAIFYCLHDGGARPRIRPILLALAIDHLVVAGRPLAALVRPLVEAQGLSHEDRRSIEEQLGKALVQNLHEYRRPADEIILILGWLRKGANVALLSELTGLNNNEVEAALIQIRDLSFVKIRPADQRIFLHDEMYDLLQRSALERRAPNERQRVFEILHHYYEKQIQEARSRIDALYRPQADTFEETLPDPVEVRRERARLQDAIVEDLSYRLQWDANGAFQQYFLYTEEAMGSSDEILWALLRAEMFGFLATASLTIASEQAGSLSEAHVTADSAVRWVEWLFHQEKFDEARKIADQLAKTEKELVEAGGELFVIHLNIWRATLYVYAPDYQIAERMLQQAVEQLRVLTKVSNYPKIVISLRARAYTSLGYLFRSKTQYYEAVTEYAKAIPLWQTVKLSLQQAASLNDRAFALSKLGQFHVAIPLAKEGLRLREQLGPRSPVGLSINTLALIELAQYDFAGGLRDARRAVEIFRRLNSRRGLGLALIALADANRRNAHSVTNVQQGKSAEWLAQAAEAAIEASNIFTAEIQELFRLREALRELGKDYAEWARIRQKHPALIAETEARGHKYSVEELTHLSEHSFQQAFVLAKNDLSGQIDILIDWVLLYWYSQLYLDAPEYKTAMLRVDAQLLNQIAQLIPERFHTPPAIGEHPPRVWSWVQAGYLHLLRGHLTFGYWYQHQTDDSLLAKAIEHYTLCLACHRYFSEYVFQEMRRALNNIYENLVLLTPQQKVKVYPAITATEEQYGLPRDESPMSQFMVDRFGPVEVFSFLV